MTEGVNPFINTREHYHDFVEKAEKIIEDINNGTTTLDDLIINLDYETFSELADTVRSSLYNILQTNPKNINNLEECFNAFDTMTEADFEIRKSTLTSPTPPTP